MRPGNALEDIGPNVPVRLADACRLFLGGSFTTAWLRRQIQLGNCESLFIAGQYRVTRSQIEALCAKIEIDPTGHRRHAALSASVYFVRCNEFLKIGYAANVGERFRTMQTASPYEMELLGTMAGGVEMEEQLHRRFRHLQHRGEWFRLEGELAEFVRAAGFEPNGAMERD